MKATHICYKHPNHLRVEDGKQHAAWDIVRGDHMVDAVCMAPSHSMWKPLNRKGLPCMIKQDGGKCPIHG